MHKKYPYIVTVTVLFPLGISRLTQTRELLELPGGAL